MLASKLVQVGADDVRIRTGCLRGVGGKLSRVMFARFSRAISIQATFFDDESDNVEPRGTWRSRLEWDVYHH